MNRREDAIERLGIELERQDKKWGYPQNNHPFEWISILAEEVGELAQAINEACFDSGKNPGKFDHAIEEAVQTAAVALSIVDHLGRIRDGESALDFTQEWQKPGPTTPADAPVWWWCEGHQAWELRYAGGVDPDHTEFGWVVLTRENTGPPAKGWRAK